MKLYHGSDVEVKSPKLLTVKGRTMDFGCGFYLTSVKLQAEAFTRMVNKRNKTTTRVVSVYDFDDKGANALQILRFGSASEEWLDFVMANRSNTYKGKSYDIIIGPIANDNVYRTMLLYERGLLNKMQAIDELLTKRLFDQYAFATVEALNFLTFKESVLV